MNNDLISRNALKKDFKERLAKCDEWIEKAKDKETRIRASTVKAFIAEVIMTIDNAPTVTPTFGLFRDMLYSDCEKRPQGEWISINERLPEYSGLYLISVDELVTVANFTGTYFMRGNRRVEVIAWQTLPEPYQKGGAK